MDKITALREKCTALAKLANELLANKADAPWSPEDQAKFDGFTKDILAAKAEIKAIEQMRELDADEFFNAAVDEHTPRDGKGKKKDDGEIDAMQAVAIYLRHGNNVTTEQAIAIRNAMSTTTPAEGGYTVPSEVVAMVIDKMMAMSSMRSVAEVITTDSGNPMSYPSSDGTAEIGEIVAENVGVTALDITFGTVPLNPYKYSSKKIALPVELIQDSAIDIVAFVTNRLAQRIARIQNKHFTTGTGTAQPTGIVTAAVAGKTGIAGQTLTVIYQDLVDLKHSVNRAYRSGAKFMMADLAVAVVAGLKDTTGRPIWTPNLLVNEPDTLVGYPVVINDDMAAMGVSAKSILFGDLSQYKIRDVKGSTVMRRFDDSAFALLGQVGFCGWQRSGGNLIDPAAVRLYVNSAT